MKSPISWVGGKFKLANDIISLIPEHKRYVEVFGGAGWVLFKKDESQEEVFNDLDSNLMNFWGVVKNYPKKFIKRYEWEIISREVFNDYKEKYLNNNYKDEFEQAHVFYYLVKTSFGSVMISPSFGTGKCKSRLNLNNVKKDIMNASKRLENVILENQSFEKIFEKYDDEETFFFLDSPYRSTKDYAVGKFTDDNYRELAEYCKNAKGKWLYTINDDEFIRDLFKDFNIVSHDVFYSVSKAEEGRKEYKELIITNYKI